MPRSKKRATKKKATRPRSSRASWTEGVVNVERSRIEMSGERCPFCHDKVQAADEKTACSGCMAWHHAGCWGEHGGCSACGGRASGTEPVVPPARSAAALKGGALEGEPAPVVRAASGSGRSRR